MNGLIDSSSSSHDASAHCLLCVWTMNKRVMRGKRRRMDRYTILPKIVGPERMTTKQTGSDNNAIKVPIRVEEWNMCGSFRHNNCAFAQWQCGSRRNIEQKYVKNPKMWMHPTPNEPKRTIWKDAGRRRELIGERWWTERGYDTCLQWTLYRAVYNAYYYNRHLILSVDMHTLHSTSQYTHSPPSKC